MRPPLTTSITRPVTGSPCSCACSIAFQAISKRARFFERIRRPSASSFVITSAAISSPTRDLVGRVHRAADRELAHRDDAFGLVTDVDEDLVLVDAHDGAVDDLPLVDRREGRLVVRDQLARLGIASSRRLFEPRIVEGGVQSRVVDCLVGHKRVSIAPGVQTPDARRGLGRTRPKYARGAGHGLPPSRFQAAAYGAPTARAYRGERGPRRPPGAAAGRSAGTSGLVFVVGSPRSGTSFTGKALGSQPGFVDLGEVPPLKAAVPRLAGVPGEAAGARGAARSSSASALLGLVRGLRGVEQNARDELRARGRARSPIRRRRPCTCCATAATSSARCSSAAGCGADAAAATMRGSRTARTRASGSSRSGARSSSRRARRGARRGPGAATSRAARGGARAHDRASLRGARREPARARRTASRRRSARSRRRCGARSREVHGSSVGRWRRDLAAEQVADVEAEAGALLAELGYL